VPETLVAGVLDALLVGSDVLIVVLGSVAEVTGKEELGVVPVLLFAGPELVSNGALTVPAATCGRK
jgi:hypothetical protein